MNGVLYQDTGNPHSQVQLMRFGTEWQHGHRHEISPGEWNSDAPVFDNINELKLVLAPGDYKLQLEGWSRQGTRPGGDWNNPDDHIHFPTQYTLDINANSVPEKFSDAGDTLATATEIGANTNYSLAGK